MKYLKAFKNIACPSWAGKRSFARGVARSVVLLFAAAIGLSACAETELVLHAGKKLGASGPVAKKDGDYKVGKPYQINGAWYYPAVNYKYDETGIASWYGDDFHGKLTANGATYDMNAVTAAHKTLPLPSLVRVTNLENGRSLVVRVNDRGPYVNGRILDASRRTAQLLGFQNKGTARVRVQILPDESRAMAMGIAPEVKIASNQEGNVQIAAAPRENVSVESLPPPPGASATPGSQASDGRDAAVAPSAERPKVTEVATVDTVPEDISFVPVRSTRLYIQAGAFADLENAQRLRQKLSSLGHASVTGVTIGTRELYRVRLGPVDSVKSADMLLDSVLNAGYKDARLIVID